MASDDDKLIQPINLDGLSPPDDDGFLIVRLKQAGREARNTGNLALDEILEEHGLTAKPLITSIGTGEVERLERGALESEWAPLRSLLTYWRVDARSAKESLKQIEAALRALPDVDFVYREKPPSDPVHPADDPYSSKQEYLDPAPKGIDARWVWTQRYGDGAGMRFIDLEQGWLLVHQDLPALSSPIVNDNHDGIGGYVGNHGAAVLGEVAGVDNAVGIIGIAPNASVRTVSWWKRTDPGTYYVVNALMAAIAANPPPHVILIEVQIGKQLPVETEIANVDAIRLATAAGIIVVEAAGNGNRNLDAWTDATTGKNYLNRASADFIDSGAILVGAGTAACPHNRSVWNGGQGSNYGSRVDCFGWGNAVVSAGYGDLKGSGNKSYTKSFGGTSAAAPMIAGAALLLQGMYFGSTGSLVSPGTMRTFLSDPGTGTAQGGGVAGHIGVMPDLRKIVETTLGLPRLGP